MSAISRLAAAVTLCAASLGRRRGSAALQPGLAARRSQPAGGHDLMQVTLYSENQGSDPAKLAAETTSVLNAAVADARKVKGVTISLGSRNSYPVYDDRARRSPAGASAPSCAWKAPTSPPSASFPPTCWAS